MEASGERFASLAELCLELGGAKLKEAVEMTEKIDALQRDTDDGDAILKLRKERDALEKSAEMSDARRGEVFAALGESMSAVAEGERAIVELL